MQHIYMGQWRWTGEAWSSPVAGIPFGAFDLRSVAACSSRGLSDGYGIFVYPQPVHSPGLVYLGERHATVLATRKATIKTALGLGENIVASTVGGVVAELFLQHAEPKWNLRWGRLRGRNWQLSCLGEVWATEQIADKTPEWAYVLEALRADYQKVKAEVALQLFPSDYHRRYLQALLEQYRISNYEDITLDSRDSPLPHGTTYTETWPTVSTTISSGQDQAWTELTNDAEVALVGGVNRLRNVTADSFSQCRCETALASDVHFCQGTMRITVAENGTFAGPCTRWAAAAQTCYVFEYRNNAAEEILLEKLVAGVETALATFDDDTPVANTDYVLRLTSKSNSTHTCARDGVNKITNHSNADITGNVRCGALVRGMAAGRGNWHLVSAEDTAVETAPFFALF